jgi:hypothetical protein
MPTTPGLDVINLSLRNIGQQKITQAQLDANSTPQTQAALDCWAFALKETLAGYDWGFARVEEALVVIAVATYEPVNYEYAYVRPANCLAIRRIFNASTSEKTISEKYAEMYDVTNAKVRIVTDIEDAYIRYTYYLTDTTLYTPYFNTAFSHRLSAAIVVALNGSEDTAKGQITIFNTMISEAHRHDSYGTNEVHEANEKSNFVDARG